MDTPRPPPPGQQITFLYALDPDASRRFYGAVLGLPLVLDQGSCAIYAAAGTRAFLGVCRASGPREAADPRREGGVVLTLVCDAVGAWHDYLAAAEVPILAPPSRHPVHGILHFFFRDPAGYLLEIQQFEDAFWPAPD